MNINLEWSKWCILCLKGLFALNSRKLLLGQLRAFDVLTGLRLGLEVKYLITELRYKVEFIMLYNCCIKRFLRLDYCELTLFLQLTLT